MTKAVIYTRVSTDEQAKNGLSLKGQKDAAIKYCQDGNIEVAALFSDEGESAKTTQRPQLMAALEFCQKNFRDIDYFIIWKLDRLARNTEDHLFIKALLKKHGVQLKSVTEPIEDTPTGRLMEVILAGYSQFDNEVRGERSSGGVKRRAEEGGWPHMAPLGFRNIKDEYKRPTITRTEQAPLVAKWLREFLKGGYNQKDANQLAWDIGIRSKKDTRLSYQQTCNMLRDIKNAGYVYSKMLAAPIKGLHFHEALITLEEYEAIQAKLDNCSKPQNSVRATEEWPLRGGIVKCADCGASITGSSPKGRSKNYPIYHCPNCRARIVGHRVSASKEYLHEQFEELLESVTPSEATLKLFREMVVKKQQHSHQELADRQKELQSELERLQNKKQRVLELFIEGSLTADEKFQQTEKLESDILRTNLKLNEAREQTVDAEVLIDFGINMIQNVPKLWRIADEVERQRLQAAIFPEGLVYDFQTGFGTAKISDLYEVIQQIDEEESNLVGVVGIEPTTKRL
jgi:site-specific DNA recombinase